MYTHYYSPAKNYEILLETFSNSIYLDDIKKIKKKDCKDVITAIDSYLNQASMNELSKFSILDMFNNNQTFKDTLNNIFIFPSLPNSKDRYKAVILSDYKNELFSCYIGFQDSFVFSHQDTIILMLRELNFLK